MIVDTKYQFGVGIPIESTARNGKIADGANVARLAAYINMIAAQRMKILAFAGNSLALPITNTLTPRVKFHTSPNCGGVEAIMVLGPGTSATAFGAYTWTIGGIAQITRLITGNTGGVNGLNDLVVTRQVFVDGSGNALAGDTDYVGSLAMSTGLTLYQYTVYELPRSALDTSTDTAVATDVFHYNAPILDRDVAALVDTTWKIYRRQGPTQFAWTTTDTTAPSANGSTWRNILDSTTTGFATNAGGFWTIPYRKNRLTGTTVNVVFWAYCDCTGTATGEVRLVNSGGTIATITGVSGAGAYYSTNTTLDATISTSDLVIVEHHRTAGGVGDAIKTHACGVYEYLT